MSSKPGRIPCTLAIFVFLVSYAAGQSPTPVPVDDNLPAVVSRDESVVERVDNDRTGIRDSQRTLPGVVDMTALPAAPTSFTLNISEAQKQMVLYLDILTKTEARAELLRSRLFSIIEKENSLMSSVSQLEFGLRPDQIQNSAALTGSLRPENVREARMQSLQTQKANTESLLAQVRASRRNLESAIVAADRLVERVRSKFEALVDAALSENDEF